jgi:diadenosine tetraphosphate (Ap4A) HIT family hydrolase
MPDTHCPLCSPTPEALLWSDTFCHTTWVDDANYPGFCRVVLNAHVKEMTDLPPDQQQRLMTVVFAVETAVREVVQPDKINLASLGNVVPHLHWHVIPRWQDDVNFPDAIWAAPRRSSTPRQLPADFRQQIHAQIETLLPTLLQPRE